jgi:tetratricopeptide (TPR) repeat protein
MDMESKAENGPQEDRPLAAIYSELGHALFRSKRFADAAQAFREALRDRPDAAELQVSLGQAYQAQQRHEEALRAYLEAVRLAPDASPALELCQQLLTPELATGVADWANTVWRSALEKRAMEAGTRGSVHLLLGRINLYRGAFPEALQDFQVARQCRPGDVFSLEGLGESLWREGHPERALPILEQAMNLADQLGDADRRGTTRLRLGRVLMDLKRYQEASAVVEQGLSLNEAPPVEFLTLLGKCRLALGQPEPALSAADAALQRDSSQMEAHALRAAALYDLKRFEEAVKAADAVLRVVPNNPLAIRIKAQAIIDGKLEKYIPQAIRLLEVYLRQQPADAARHRLLIRVLRENQRPVEDVVNALRRAVAGEPDEERPAFLTELAETCLAAGHADEAIQALDSAAKIDPGARSAQWWQLYGDAQAQAGNTEAATHSYEEGLRLEPANAALLDHHAELLFKLDRLPEAIEAWRRLIETSPVDGRTRLRITEALRRQGDLPGALTAVGEAVGVLNWNDYPIKAQAYQLKAGILEALARPSAEIADAWFEAGRQQYWGNNTQEALTLFRRARAVDDTHQATCWYLSDALLHDCYRQTAPYVDQASLEESLRIWEAGYRMGRPENGEADYSWAYTVRALINEQTARLRSPDRAGLWWEAVAYLERAIVLRADEVYRWAHLARFHRYLDNDNTTLAVTRGALQIDPREVAALDERAAGLADSAASPADWSAALEAIEARQKVENSLWLGAVKGLVLLYLGRPEEALPLLTQQLEADGEDVWSRSLRAFTYLLLNQPALAREDYQRMWDGRDDPRLGHVENRSKFASAACHLSFLTGQRALLDEAIAIYQSVRRDPIQRVDDSLGCCYLARGGPGDLEEGEARLTQYIVEAVDGPSLESVERFDLPLLETRLRDLPQREQALKVLERVRPVLAARRAELDRAHPRTEAEEIARAQEEMRSIAGRAEPGGWTWIAAQAMLAHWHTAKMEWAEALAIYRRLLAKAPEGFPEAEGGLVQCRVGLQEAGDEALKRGRAAEAKSCLLQALDLAPESSPAGKDVPAGLHARLGCACFQLGELPEARAHFAEAIRAYGEAGATDAGEALGAQCVSLLPGTAAYWALDAEWQALPASPDSSAPVRDHLPAARRRLSEYLSRRYQLSEQAGKSVQLLPVVTPIAVEMGAKLIPPNAETDWPLIKVRFPEMRQHIENDTGVVVPGVRVRSNEIGLSAESYLVLLDEVPLAAGEVHMDRRYTMTPGGALEAAGIPSDAVIATADPLTGAPGFWIGPEHWSVAASHNLTLWEDPLEFMVRHIEAILGRNLWQFLGVQEVENLIERWSGTDRGAALVKAALPDPALHVRFARVLRALVKERVPIGAWENILETVRDTGLESEEPGAAVRAIRIGLKPRLPGNGKNDERRQLPAEIEDRIARWIWRQDDRTYLAILPEATQDLLAGLRKVLEPAAGNVVLVASNSEVRPFVRRLIQHEFPDVMVIANDELLARGSAAGSKAEGAYSHA